MNQGSNEQEFVSFAKKHLDASVEQLAPSTLTRLGQARREALTQDPQKFEWTWPVGGLATACVVILSLVLWMQSPIDSQPSPVTEDLELLASSDSLEFYEELEFYDWLAENDQAS